MLGVPRFWEDFARSGVRADLSHLRNPISGGDKISPASVEMINRFLASNGARQLKVGYGASELCGAVSVMTDYGVFDSLSVGEPLPGVTVMVVDPDTGKELEYNQNG